MIDQEQLPRFIQTLLTPMLMVTGAASMNWGLQRLQFSLVTRLRTLNDERLEIFHSPERDVVTDARLVQIEEQLRWLQKRVRYTRNSIASFYIAALLFFACSISIAAIAWFQLPAAWVCTLGYELGMLAIYAALMYTLADVWVSYRALEVDTQL